MRGKDTPRSEFTGGQLVLAKMIEELGFSVDMEVPFPPYRLDLYLLAQHLAIEFDGAHSFRNRDRKRDDYLMEHYSLPVLRIVDLTPKEEVQRKILHFVGQWTNSAKERKEILW